MNTCIKPDSSPLPWVGKANGIWTDIYDASDNYLFSLPATDEIDQIIYLKLLRSVNSRAALVEALNDAGWYLTHPDEVGKIQLDILLEEIRSAIAAEKGEK